MKQCTNCELIYVSESVDSCRDCGEVRGDYSDVFNNGSDGLKDIPYGELKNIYQHCSNCQVYKKTEHPTCTICGGTTYLKQMTPDQDDEITNESVLVWVASYAAYVVLIKKIRKYFDEDRIKSIYIFENNKHLYNMTTTILKVSSDLADMAGIEHELVQQLAGILVSIDKSFSSLKYRLPVRSKDIMNIRVKTVELANILLDIEFPTLSKMELHKYIYNVEHLKPLE